MQRSKEESIHIHNKNYFSSKPEVRLSAFNTLILWNDLTDIIISAFSYCSENFIVLTFDLLEVIYFPLLHIVHKVLLIPEASAASPSL
jgi:hypothetical protein